MLGGTASDNVGVTQVTWINQTTGDTGVAVGTTSWTISNINLAVGQNVIVVRAFDAAGNSSTDTITVTFTPPAGTLTGIASDNVGVTQVVWVNQATGASGTATGTNNWSVPGGITLIPGTNNIVVTAFDAAGNQSSDTLAVIYDPNPPTVTITSPTTGPTFTVSNPFLTVAGSANDAESSVASLSWVNAQGGSGTVNGTTTWNTVGLTLVPGLNQITITGVDAAGNTGTDSIAVTLASAAPPPIRGFLS